MTQISAIHPIIDRIAELRSKVRTLLIIHGLGIVIATLLVAAMVLAMFDYWLHFAPMLRLLLLIAALAGIVFLAFRRMVRPLSQPLSEKFLASRVESADATLSDELMSAVQFIRAGLPKQNAMAAKLIEQAEARAQNIDFSEALDGRPAARSGMSAVIALVVFAAICALTPSMARIALARWTDPFGAHYWPQITHVRFDWAAGQPPTVLPAGEPVVVRAVVTSGFSSGMKVWLSSTGTQGQADDLMTQQQSSSSGQGVFEKKIEPSGEELQIRLSAGDDTEHPWTKIRLAPRPVVQSVEADITPPPYVKNRADAATQQSYPDLLQRSARAIEGSQIRLIVTSSKPLALNSRGEPDVSFQDLIKESPIAFVHSSKLLSPTQAEISFPAASSLQARVVVHDTDGFENRVIGTASLEVVPDALPSIIITDPRRNVIDVTPDATLPVEVHVNDDLGLTELVLRADNFDAKPSDAPRFTTPLPMNQSPFDPNTGVSAISQYQWDLSALSMKPGDRLSCYAMVRDNYEMPDPKNPGQMLQHPFVKSAPFTLQFQTREEIEDSARKQLQAAGEAIKVLLDQQTQTNAQTHAVQKAAAQSGVTTQQQKELLGNLAGQQAQEKARAAGIKQQLDDLNQTMKQNKLDQGDMGQLADEVAKGMKSVEQTDMNPAHQDLSDAQQSVAPPTGSPAGGSKSDAQKAADKAAADKTAQSAASAEKHQQDAMNSMQDMIAKLGAAGDVANFRSQFRDFQNKQQDQEKQARDLARQTMGTDQDKLPQDLKDKIDALAKAQADLAQKVSNATDQMSKAADSSSKNDPAASETMKSAAQASTSANVSGSMQQASSSISKNQMASASNSQSQASQGLQQVLDKLDDFNKRQLEHLSQQLADLMERLKKQIEAQTAINLDTTAAGKAAVSDALDKISDRQSRTQQNCIILAADVEKARDARPAALDIRDATEFMGTAMVALLKNSQADALDPQKQALDSLNEALKKLDAQKKKVDSDLHQADMAQLQKEYERILAAQVGIKTASDDFAAQKKLRGELLHPQLVKVAEQAKAQDDLKTQTLKISDDYKLPDEAPVVDWVSHQAADAMGESKDHLSKAELGEQLADAQNTAIDRLQRIIDALKEEQKKDDFNKGGGGGGGGGGKPPLIPPVAQLKMLKAMQTLVNSDTLKEDQRLAQAKDDQEKAELKQDVTKVGKTQDQIKDLAQKLVDKMQGGQ